ncbi:MAG TPA: S8 family peptidase [Nocardioidaceae bacterium]|nr:S8 family peptidase [Nocardioidaceae bacterium]
MNDAQLRTARRARRPRLTGVVAAAALATATVCTATVVPARAGTPAQTGSATGQSPAGAYVGDQVIVGYRPGTSPARLAALERAAGASRGRMLGRRAMLLDVGKGRVQTAIAALHTRGAVEYAEPNYVMHESATPDDPGFPVQWGLENTGQLVNGSRGRRSGADISATSAWNVTTTTGPVVIGEVDSGIDYHHPDLVANIWSNPGGIGGCPAGTHGYSVVTRTCDPMDNNRHGTFVAGIMGASGNNGTGVAGVAWHTTMLPVQFVHAQGWGSVGQLIQALDWIVAAKRAGVDVDVVNDSAVWSGWSYSQALSDELAKLADNGVLFVTAAGNNHSDNDNTPRYPCDYGASNEICVAALTQWDKLPYFSNYGAKTVDLAAPGKNIYSTLPGGSYGYWNGTSFSTAYVSGAAGLIAGHCPSLSVTRLRADILGHVDVLSALTGKVATGGQLDLDKALRACGS